MEYASHHDIQEEARKISVKTGIDENLCYRVLSEHYEKNYIPPTVTVRPS